MEEGIERIAEGVWVGIPAPGEAAMGAVVDQRRMLVIDTSCYSVFAKRFVDHVVAHEDIDGPTAVFVTHRHVDHFAGADVLAAPIIAHRLTRAGMAAYSQEWLDETLHSWEAKGMILPGLIAEPRVVLPEITFIDEMAVHVGEVEVRMKHVGGHTADLSIAYLPRQGILFGTDNVFNGKVPYVGEGDFTTWIACLQEMAEWPIEVVVPGHGALGGVELLHAQIAELQQMHAAWLSEV